MVSKIEDFRLHELKNPKFIESAFVTYKQNGIEKSWEVVKAHDSVAILIYHKERDSFVLVKQFRPAVYMGGTQDGITVELCAGIVDKELTLAEIAMEEIEEECGYAVPVESITRITQVNNAVGFAGSKQTIFYTEVTESMRVSDGGGIETELIEVVDMPISKAREFIFDESIAKTTGLLFALMWWFDRRG
ncbi:NUDIX domain-containing protein [Sulfurovum sp. bin170]|uniref:NUDIX domain-containing protein n=1 Tax=Sulfurovum sp. bin170 TaxID=2695268 RepID=UPI0013DFEA41|nr:NUDIX domain-containing protein [Sulfurovum sp. bin170]NEW61682.1 NUDIX domain-containing protein [Sulfurovum sp. bin170]